MGLIRFERICSGLVKFLDERAQKVLWLTHGLFKNRVFTETLSVALETPRPSPLT